MSRGFVKEGDQEETPIVAPRAFLPKGAVNYVTAKGLNELKQERDLLLKKKNNLIEQSAEVNRVQINHNTAKLDLLEARINSARVVDLANQPLSEIHFGATVSLFKPEEKCECQYQIVGVDEANILQNKVSFLSPIARNLLNKKVGDSITLSTPKGERIMRIEAIKYQ